MDEKQIERLFRIDLSLGTEAFRDALLARCLAALGSDEYAFELDDDDLDLLAAAGNPQIALKPTNLGDNRSKDA